MNTLFKLFAALVIFAIVPSCAHAQTTPLTNVQMDGADNQVITGATLTIKSGGTLTIEGGGTITGVQSTDAKLTSFVGLTGATDTIAYFTGGTSMGTTSYTAFARSLDALTGRTSFFDAIAPASPTTNDLNYFNGTHWDKLHMGANLAVASGTLNAASGATANGTFVTLATEGALPNSFSLGSLSAGLLKIAVASGIATISPATPGGDYLAPAAIGSTVEAWSANLDAWSLKTAPGGTLVGTTDVQTLTNKTLTSPTINGATIATSSLSSPTFTGTWSLPSNTRQTFAPGSTSEGLNVGSVTADPGSPSNGGLWYRSDTNVLNARINGSTVSLGGGGGGVTGPGSSVAHHIASYTNTTGGALEDASSIAVSSGTLTSSTSLTLVAGGSNQNVTLTPSGTGLIVANGVLNTSGRLQITGATVPTNRGGMEWSFSTGAGGLECYAVGTTNLNGLVTSTNYLNVKTGPNTGFASTTALYVTPTGHTILNNGSTDDGTNMLQVTGGAKITHLVGGSSAPTIAAGTGAGTSPTIAVAGTDLGFTITLTTGSSPTASATVATVTYNSAFGSAPHAVFAPANGNAAALSGTGSVFRGTSTTTFTLTVGSSALAAATQYIWDVIAVQ